jgi:hypothetical protein
MFRRASVVTSACLCVVFVLSHPAFTKDNKHDAGPVAAPAAESDAGPADPIAYLLAQFGPTLSYVKKFPPIVTDFDLDGTQDIALVVTGKNPLLDEQQYHYKTIDPYNAFFGWSDTRDTIQFVTSEAEPKFLAIVHDWKADTPKAKFVVINLSFERLYPARYLTKKRKTLPCIELEDRTGLTSDIFWGGKQWKWADKSLAN